MATASQEVCQRMAGDETCKENAEKAKTRTTPPPKVPRRVRGKQTDPANDIS